MPELDFQIAAIEIERYAAVPLLLFKLRIVSRHDGAAAVTVSNIMLQCQVRIETTRRHYQPHDQERLVELFGAPQRWRQTMQSLLWTHTSVLVPAFSDSCLVDLPVPCSYDFNIAATKYFYALEQGHVPLTLLFSGTVFYSDAEGFLQMEQISWNKEAGAQLPVKLWQELMTHYYPDSSWLRLQQEVFDRLYRYKLRHGFASWERALGSLLDSERHDREESGL
jgi:hypothetical protein